MIGRAKLLFCSSEETSLLAQLVFLFWKHLGFGGFGAEHTWVSITVPPLTGYVTLNKCHARLHLLIYISVSSSRLHMT